MKARIVKTSLIVIYFIIALEIIIKFLESFEIKSLIVPSLYINYEGGFIRRGIFGSLLHLVSSYFNIDPVSIQVSITAIAGLALIILIFYTFIKRKLPFYVLFSSFLLGNILAYNMFFFVDIFLILLLFLQVILIQKTTEIYKKALIANALMIFGILLHEVYFIIAIIPTLYLIGVTDISKKSVSKIFYFVPSFVLFILMGTIFNGKSVDEHTIVNSWEIANSDYFKKIGNLYWTFNTNAEVLLWKHPIFTKNPLFLLFFLINTLFIFFSFFIFLKQNFTDKKKYIFSFLLFQYIAIIALSLIAVDYVRWFWMINIATILTLSYSHLEQGFLFASHNFPRFQINKYATLNYILILFLGLPLGDGWTTSRYIYTMPITHFFNFFQRIISVVH